LARGAGGQLILRGECHAMAWRSPHDSEAIATRSCGDRHSLLKIVFRGVDFCRFRREETGRYKKMLTSKNSEFSIFL